MYIRVLRSSYIEVVLTLLKDCMNWAVGDSLGSGIHGHMDIGIYTGIPLYLWILYPRLLFNYLWFKSPPITQVIYLPVTAAFLSLSYSILAICKCYQEEGSTFRKPVWGTGVWKTALCLSYSQSLALHMFHLQRAVSTSLAFADNKEWDTENSDSVAVRHLRPLCPHYNHASL